MAKKRRTVPAATPAPIAPPAVPPARRRWLWWLLGAGLALALVGGAGAWWALSASAAALVPRQPPADPSKCRAFPQFAKAQGLSEKTTINTRDTTRVGLTLSDSQSGKTLDSATFPSWDDAGYLGAFTVDAAGNIFVAPAPQTSLLRNPPGEQNRVYRIDSATGEMKLFADLPAAARPDPAENPYGVMGLFADCATNSLYVTSVAGSSRDAEVGRVFRLDLANGAVLSQIEQFDAIGVAAYGDLLLVGRARLPEVWAIRRDSSGNLVGAPAFSLSVADRLNDGTAKVRRIVIDGDANVTLTISPFTYTLEPPSAQSEQRLTYRIERGAWQAAQ